MEIQKEDLYLPNGWTSKKKLAVKVVDTILFPQFNYFNTISIPRLHHKSCIKAKTIELVHFY